MLLGLGVGMTYTKFCINETTTFNNNLIFNTSARASIFLLNFAHLSSWSLTLTYLDHQQMSSVILLSPTMKKKRCCGSLVMPNLHGSVVMCLSSILSALHSLPPHFCHPDPKLLAP